ncbi:MAG TPA: hypothetical protein VKB15_05530 [Xanthobacteraceae bacterium]|nr:hypothetical protein [Xanthobacteraceae bacterium]
MTNLPEMIPLSDAELDAVAGGHAVAAGGLANIAVDIDDVNVLNHFFINVNVEDTLRDIANNNNVGVGAVIQVLGGAAAILQRQTQ